MVLSEPLLLVLHPISTYVAELVRSFFNIKGQITSSILQFITYLKREHFLKGNVLINHKSSDKFEFQIIGGLGFKLFSNIKVFSG